MKKYHIGFLLYYWTKIEVLGFSLYLFSAYIFLSALSTELQRAKVIYETLLPLSAKPRVDWEIGMKSFPKNVNPFFHNYRTNFLQPVSEWLIY